MTGQIDAWLEEGLRYYSQGDPARALEAWYRILDVDPGHSLTQQYVAYVRQVYHIEAPAPTEAQAVASSPALESAPAPPVADAPAGSWSPAPETAPFPGAAAEAAPPAPPPPPTAEPAPTATLDELADLAPMSPVVDAPPEAAAASEGGPGAAAGFDDAIVDLAPPASTEAPRTDRVDLEALAMASIIVPESATTAPTAAAPTSAAPIAATVPPSFAATSPPAPSAPVEEPRKGIVGFDASADWSDLVDSAFDVVAPKPGQLPVTAKTPLAGASSEGPSAPASPQAAAPPSLSPPAGTLPAAPETAVPAEGATTVPRMSTQNPWAPRRTTSAVRPAPRPAPPASAEAFVPPPHTPVLPPPGPLTETAPAPPPPPAGAPEPPVAPTTPGPDLSFDPWIGDSVPSQAPVLEGAARVAAEQHLDLPPPTPPPVEVDIDLGFSGFPMPGPAPGATAGSAPQPPPPSSPSLGHGGGELAMEFDVDLDLGAEAAPAAPAAPVAPVVPATPVAPSATAPSAAPVAATTSPSAPSAPEPGQEEPKLAEVVPIWKRSAVEEVPQAQRSPSAPSPASSVEERSSGAKVRYNDYSNYGGSSPPPVRVATPAAPLPQPTLVAPPAPPRASPQAAAPPPPPPPPPAADTGGIDPWAEVDAIGVTVDLDQAPSPSASLEQLLSPGRDGGGLAAWPTSPGSATPAAGPEDECEALMRGARELFELGDFSGSLDLVEKALRSNPDHEGARAYMQKNEATLLRMYESKLGSLHKTPRQLVPPDEVIWMNMHHKAGFILSQVDGMLTYDDLLSISGMSRFDTMRILHDLVQQGIIG